jgi:2-iminobutanoate/2-iminopropanoate deaminase
MKKEEILSKKAPAAVGPYSQAVKFGNLVFCSGQIGTDPKAGGSLHGGIKEQTRQVLANLKEVLNQAGADFDSVLKVNIFLQSMDDFKIINEIYAEYFKRPFPARATVAVAGLPKDALVEIECIAYAKKGGCCSCDCQCGCC